MTNNSTPLNPQIRNTVKPFIITKNATELISFIKKVFNAQEINKAGRTVDDDGLLLHSEFVIGDSIVMVIDTREGWPFTPSLLMVFVEDAESTLQTAKELGATIITGPTEFYGDVFSRFQDPWNNIWWVYQYGENANWDDEAADGDETWSSEPDKETLQNLNYIYDTLMEAMQKLGDL